MKKQILLLGSICLMLSTLSFGQSVEVIDFPKFQERLDRTDDTLYIYNFWATWCRPCVKELPYFTKLDSMYKDKNIKFEFISLDVIDQLDISVKPMVAKKLSRQKVILLDAPKYNEWIDKVSPEWSGALPTTLAVYKPENLYVLKQQSFEYPELKSWIDNMLTSITSK